MPTNTDKTFFRRNLLAWYDRNKRDLPWRASRDPYGIWVSEVMLQQTRVAAVLEHYRRFMLRFPTVQKLAGAREASVLAVWSGLGYYRRARMLHAAAKVIVRKHGGEFPATIEQLQDLPGIGRYTAAAIASIAFDLPVAVVDGNVERVLQRLKGRALGQSELWGSANDLLCKSRPGDSNQAMMELGATVCIPRAPMCLACPVTETCSTRGEAPITARRAPPQRRETHYALHHNDNCVFLVQRPAEALLMPGMWELPQTSKHAPSARLLTLRHSITATQYHVTVYSMTAAADTRGKWVPSHRLDKVALTGLARKILRKAEIL